MFVRKPMLFECGNGNSNSHGARPVHLIITMIKWIRTSRLSIKNSLSERARLESCFFFCARRPAACRKKSTSQESLRSIKQDSVLGGTNSRRKKARRDSAQSHARTLVGAGRAVGAHRL